MDVRLRSFAAIEFAVDGSIASVETGPFQYLFRFPPARVSDATRERLRERFGIARLRDVLLGDMDLAAHTLSLRRRVRAVLLNGIARLFGRLNVVLLELVGRDPIVFSGVGSTSSPPHPARSMRRSRRAEQPSSSRPRP